MNKKTIGCCVEHKHTGTFAVCDEDMVFDNDWIITDIDPYYNHTSDEE